MLLEERGRRSIPNTDNVESRQEDEEDEPSKSQRRRSRSRSKHRSRSRSRSRSRRSRSNNNKNKSTLYDEDDDVVEEGQEIMLIEELDLHPKVSNDEDNDDIAGDGEAGNNNDNSSQNNNNDNNNNMTSPSHQNSTKPKPTKTKPTKSTRKVQQVLLVPTNGDLLMERYRQASQRAQKARALLDQALNWDATVVNRDRLAMDAFTEAGKARLLIEQEKTPELISMLTDAKVKGEEEASRAVDSKLSQLVPAVRLPTKAATKASASALTKEQQQQLMKSAANNYNSEYDHNDMMLLRETPTMANTAHILDKHQDRHHTAACLPTMLYPHHGYRQQNDDTGGGYDDYSEGSEDDTDEHVFRAKQYLEFILPDLGDVPDDDSMAPKAVANPRSLIQQYYQQLQKSSGGTSSNSNSNNGNTYPHLSSTTTEGGSSGLGEISSLGFDESHSFDNISSRDTEDMFSMTSLNEIMDSELDDFDPEKIMSMPSSKRKLLTIRMSFGASRTMAADDDDDDDDDDEKEEDEEEAEANKDTPKSDIPPPSDVAVAYPEEAPTTPSTIATGNKQEKKQRLSLNFTRKRTCATLPASSDDASPKGHGGMMAGGFLSRFRSMKKTHHRDHHVVEESDSQSNCNSTSKSPKNAGGSDNSAAAKIQHIIAPVLSDLSDGNSQQVLAASSAAAAKKMMEGMETKLNQKEGGSIKPATANGVGNSPPLFKDQEEKKEIEKNHMEEEKKDDDEEKKDDMEKEELKTNPEDLQVQQSNSMGSSNLGDTDVDDKYTVSVLDGEDDEDDDDQENVAVEPLSLYTPTSVASIQDMPSRYSPIHGDESPVHCGSLVLGEPSAPSGSTRGLAALLGSYQADTAATKAEIPTHEVLKDLLLSPRSNANQKPSAGVESNKFDDARETEHAKETGSLASIFSGASALKAKKKNRRSIFNDIFHKKQTTAESEKVAADKALAAGALQQSMATSVNGSKTGSTPGKSTTAAKDKRNSKNTAKKPSSLQASLKKAKGEQATHPVSSPPPKKGHVSSPPPKKGQSSSKSAKKQHISSPAPKKSHRRKSSLLPQQVAKQSKPSPRSNKKAPTKAPEELKEKTVSGDTTTTPLARAQSKQSSLQTALQLAHDTVELTAIETPNTISASATAKDDMQKALDVAHAISKVKTAKTKKEILTEKDTGPGPHAGNVVSQGKKVRRRFDKKSAQEPGKNGTKKKQSTPKPSPTKSKTTSSSQSTSWVSSFHFSIKRKDQTKKANTAAPTDKKSSANGVPNNESSPPLDVDTERPSNEIDASPNRAVATTPTLECPTSATNKASNKTSNPLLPYQLMKQIDQSAMDGVDEFNVKDVAERSFIRSHTDARRRGIETPSISDKENGLGTATSPRAPKFTSPSSTPMQRNLSSPAGSILVQSPRTLQSNNTPLSRVPEHHLHRPDADGLNARTKDVREVLGGLPEAEDFGDVRARSFLSRITQGTYRQDLDLPDP